MLSPASAGRAQHECAPPRVGSSHLCGHDPDWCDRRGDLAGAIRLSRDTAPVRASVPDVHALCGHAHRDADIYPEAQGERQGHPDSHRHPGSDPDGDPDTVQPPASGLPDAAAPTDCGTDADAQDDPDRRRRDPNANRDADPDPGTHDPAELNPVADRDADPDTHQVGRPPPDQRANSSRSPFSAVIDERCSSMSTEGGWPVSITTAMRSDRRSPPIRTQSRRNVNAIGRTRFQM
jgi:hypothetical protein